MLEVDRGLRDLGADLRSNGVIGGSHTQRCGFQTSSPAARPAAGRRSPFADRAATKRFAWHDSANQQGRITFICLAFNTAPVYLSRSEARLAARGIRRHYRRELGAASVVIYIDDAYAVLPVEKRLLHIGVFGCGRLCVRLL